MALSEQEEFELLSLEREKAGVKDSGTRTPPTKLKIGAEGFSDAMRSTLQGAKWWERQAAGVGSFPRQLYEGAKQVLGREDKTNIRATRVMEEEAPVAALGGGLATVGLSALVPGAGTLAGTTGLGALTGFLQPTEGDESRATNTALGTGLAAGGKVALSALSKGTGALLGRSTARAADTAAEHSVRDATLAEARKAGYVVPRSATGEGGATSKAVESIAGKAATGQEASIRNQQITNKIAREEAGLGPREALTEANLEKARDRIAEPYRQVADLSPKAAKALDTMKQARAEAKLYHAEHNRQGTVSSLKRAEALEAKAAQAEKVIEQEAVKVTMGQSALAKDLMARLKDARVRLAKNYDVDTALNIGNGNVDAHVIGRMLNKRGEKAMSEGMRTIGKFAQAFPDFSRAKPPTQSAPGIGALKPYAAALGIGIGAEQAHERLGLSPYMMGAAALPLMGGPARNIALSKMMQGAPKYAPSATLRLSDMAARSRTLPLAAAAYGTQEQ